MTRRTLASTTAVAAALLAAAACQDHTRKSGVSPTEPIRANASAAAGAGASSVCTTYGKERAARQAVAAAKRGAEAEAANAEIAALDAVIADACGS